MANVFGAAAWSLTMAASAAIWGQPTDAQGAAAGSAIARPTLRVRVFDDVGLPAEVRDSMAAKGEAGLAVSGVHSEWSVCSSPPVAQTPADCQAQVSESDLIFRISPRKMIGKEHALGLAMADRRGGTYGTLFYPAVERTAKSVGLPVSRVLAFAVLHEVGHLLLGSDAHWPLGIMNPHWDSGRIEELTRLSRLFNRQQSKLLRARVAARLETVRGD